MDFTLKSWSFLYKTGKGSGTIVCNNGYKQAIRIKTDGGGVTFGKSKITGTGNFTGVDNINELYGSYATAQAHAGAKKSTNAQVLTKGEVSLSLTGKGEGFDLGFSFGGFTISRLY